MRITAKSKNPKSVYKNIEEEQQIDLVILFKAMTNGCYYRDTKYDDIKFSDNIVIAKKGIIVLRENDHVFLFNNNYGRTWALTKEELQ